VPQTRAGAAPVSVDVYVLAGEVEQRALRMRFYGDAAPTAEELEQLARDLGECTEECFSQDDLDQAERNGRAEAEAECTCEEEKARADKLEKELEELRERIRELEAKPKRRRKAPDGPLPENVVRLPIDKVSQR
jgi:hypothetical protein